MMWVCDIWMRAGIKPAVWGGFPAFPNGPKNCSPEGYYLTVLKRCFHPICDYALPCLGCAVDAPKELGIIPLTY